MKIATLKIYGVYYHIQRNIFHKRIVAVLSDVTILYSITIPLNMLL